MAPSLTPEQHEDFEFLRETMRWSYWPFCPVKRSRDNKIELGACYDGEAGTRRVYLGNMLTLIETGLTDVPYIDYPNSYQLLMDGWIVD